jgi:hypothetical protein
VRRQHGKPIPLDFFSRKMYSQPSLGRTKPVLPAPYKMKKAASATAAAAVEEAVATSAIVDVESAAVTQASSSSSSSSATVTAATDVIMGTTSIKLGLGRQSLGGGGMYAYDDVEDEEDIIDKAKHWEADASVPLTSPRKAEAASAGSKNSLVASPACAATTSPKMPSYGSINNIGK